MKTSRSLAVLGLGRFALQIDEKAVMAQWAVGKFVASWGERLKGSRRTQVRTTNRRTISGDELHNER
jgi:hypothetical protein